VSKNAVQQTSKVIIPNVCSIIFVHGCTGDREKTWTSQEKVLWPRDFLSKDVPSARILTWGFGAKYVFDRPDQKISYSYGLQTIGQALARDIGTWREDTVTPAERPIIFVAHSIGGLVVEQVCRKLYTKSIEDIRNTDYHEGTDSSPHNGRKRQQCCF
jgi:pimeloyl-ACP methyl ester carboxylesterase